LVAFRRGFEAGTDKQPFAIVDQGGIVHINS
jgi:hypothetical protein